MTAAEHLHAALERNVALTEKALGGELVYLEHLQNWQRLRLHATYADLMQQPRFQPACGFFLDELYGGKDFSQRHDDLARVEPIMSRLMPDRLLDTVADALEVQALSLELDMYVADELKQQSITQAHYAAAYRAAGHEQERLYQLELIDHVGHALDAVVHKFWVHRLLRMLRGPATTAGFGELQHFLESGFNAFRQLKGADDFLHAIQQREHAAMKRIFSGAEHPFPELHLP